ncbi:MAG: NUDIX domain-containing protein [Pseudomonadota bacterium]
MIFTPDSAALSAVILYDDRRRILLQHRTDDAPTFPSSWSFFGGGVEPGETFAEAAIREAYEELSYRLKSPHHWMSQPFSTEGRAYTQHIFLEAYDGSVLVLGEGQAMQWFAPRDTGALKMSAHSRAAVEALDRWLAWGQGHFGHAI